MFNEEDNKLCSFFRVKRRWSCIFYDQILYGCNTEHYMGFLTVLWVTMVTKFNLKRLTDFADWGVSFVYKDI